MLEVKGGVLRNTKLFEQGFNKDDVINVLTVLNERITQLEFELENEKDKSEKLIKKLNNKSL